MHIGPVVIVGAGPAGISAAVQCLRLGLSPRLIDRTGAAGGLIENAHWVENYPGLEPMPGPELAARLRDFLHRFGLTVERRVFVRAISRPRFFELELGEEICRARSVVFALGTRGKKLPCPGAEALDGSRLFYEVGAALERGDLGKRALVIGAGEAAFDSALSLAKAGLEVSLFGRGVGPRAAGRLREALESHPRIHASYGVSPKDFVLKNDHVMARFDSGGESFEERADVVLVAVGRQPRRPVMLAEKDRVLYEVEPDEPPGAFVVGDAHRGGLGQVGIAVGDGLAAAMSAASFLRKEFP